MAAGPAAAWPRVTHEAGGRGAGDRSERGSGELEHADVGQVAVALVVVQTVSDDERVPDVEADVPHQGMVDEAPGRLVQEGAHSEGGRLTGGQHAEDIVQG